MKNYDKIDEEKVSREQLKRLASYKTGKYRSYSLSFDRVSDRQVIEVLDSLPRGEMTNYLRELINRDIQRVYRTGKSYQYAHPRNAEIKAYMKAHKENFMHYVPESADDPSKHHFIHSVFVDFSSDGKPRKKK